MTAPTEIPACEMEDIHNQRGPRGDHSTREDPKYYQGLLDATVEAPLLLVLVTPRRVLDSLFLLHT